MVVSSKRGLRIKIAKPERIISRRRLKNRLYIENLITKLSVQQESIVANLKLNSQWLYKWSFDQIFAQQEFLNFDPLTSSDSHP